ncbi:hypothetical protein [Rubidibacter lacunae]|uniref:hypothetical protein n=1 Tax=Rubidibacter lacunae TaxID=582514 RepID=UPI0003FD56C3|nr:hypothetical protein [Rubidibacter lacunae]
MAPAGDLAVGDCWESVLSQRGGIDRAVKEARRIGYALAAGTFDWDDVFHEERDLRSCGYWKERFELDYFKRRQCTPQSKLTWKTEYRLVFRKLPDNEKLTADLLRGVVLGTEPDTRTRKRFVTVLTALARVADISVDLQDLKGSYRPAKVSPKSLPSDREIAQIHASITGTSWRWFYGMMATFGLRPS